MSLHIQAIYQNGVLRPLEPLDLAENERVTVAIHHGEADEDGVDRDFLEFAKREADPSVTLQEVRARLSKITGSLAEAVIAERGEY